MPETQFSSVNDPDFGPEPTQFSIAHLLLICFLIAVPLTHLYAANSVIPIGALIAGTILIRLTTLNSRNRRLAFARLSLMFLGSITYSLGTKLLVSALLQGLDDNGMAAVIPFFQAIASVTILLFGIWLLFGSLKYSPSTNGDSAG